LANWSISSRVTVFFMIFSWVIANIALCLWI
jgi:hypothetical protein